MSERGKVLAAMSGGVDSSMAAAILLDEGYEVIGATMRVWEPDALQEEAAATLAAARAAARFLGIPHHVADFRERFRETVVEPFIDAYCQGLTPNPCVGCNRTVKFGWLAEHGRAQGAEKIATGHYARISWSGERERPELQRGVDELKDQSYFLHLIPAGRLENILFPLGGSTKAAVRRMAAARGLPVAERPESQDICFISDDGYEQLIRENRPEALVPGPIKDREGKTIGRHRGLPAYTVGQRRGLGIASPEPYYVLELALQENALIVGRRDDLACRSFETGQVNWCSIPTPVRSFEALVQIRYRSQPAKARIEPRQDGTVRVIYLEGQPAVTPGQSAVFYSNDTVLGGGTIATAK